jgi:hypothetical protein
MKTATLKRFAGSLPAVDGISTLGEQYTATREKIIGQIQSGTLSGNKRTAGIPCPDELSTQKMLGFFERENLRIMQIKARLEEAGLPFRAIVRTEFYDELKKNKGVYTFKNIDEDGSVSVSEEHTEQFVKSEVTIFEKKAGKVVEWIQVMVSIAVIFIGEWLLWYLLSSDRPINFVPILFTVNLIGFAIIMASGLGLIFLRGIEYVIRYFIFNSSSLNRKITKKINSRGLYIFWPEYVDYADGPKVTIDFIKSPERIALSISQWKKAGYAVHISAQKEAFSLNIESIRTFIKEKIDALFEAIREARELELLKKIEARKRFWEKFDPIISAETDEFTILIDAYGGKSFVSETEVMDSVLNYYNHKLKQFQTILN